MKVSAILFDAIQRAAVANGIDPLVIAAVAYQESGLNPYIQDGDSGQSHGPMQLYREGAGKGYSIPELRDVERNLQISTAYLASKLAQYPDSLALAFTAYNWPARAAEGLVSGYGAACMTHLAILQREGLEREPAGNTEPTNLELLDAVYGFLRDAANARYKADRLEAMENGQAHLIALKHRIMPWLV